MDSEATFWDRKAGEEHARAIALERRVVALTAEVADCDASFNLRWNASVRARQRWQEATGRAQAWPGHEDLCVWLMEKLDSAEAELDALRNKRTLRAAPPEANPDAQLGALVRQLPEAQGLVQRRGVWYVEDEDWTYGAGNTPEEAIRKAIALENVLLAKRRGKEE